MKVRIRSYKSGDYDLLIDLWIKSGLPYKPLGRDSRESIEQEAYNGICRFLFAYNGDGYFGSALITHDGRKGWINVTTQATTITSA